MTNKSYIGVDSVHYAPVTVDSVAAYTPGTVAVLAPVMNITHAPKTNSKVQYADNQPFDTMSSEGETEIEVEITGLPVPTLAILLGKVFDTDSGRMFDNGGTPPDCALGFRAKKTDGEYRYFWFLKGKFSPPSEETATQTDTPDPKSTKLKYTAIRTIHEFDLTVDLTDSVKRVVGDTEDTNFDDTDWFTAVQVPVLTP